MNNFFKETYRETSGKMIGFIDSTPQRDIISNPTGKMMGYTENGWTCDRNGRRLVQGECPSFVLGNKDKLDRW